MQLFKFFTVLFLVLLINSSLSAGSPEHIQLDPLLFYSGEDRKVSMDRRDQYYLNKLKKCQNNMQEVVELNSKISILKNEIKNLKMVKLKLEELTSIINELHGKLNIKLSTSDKKKTLQVKDNKFIEKKVFTNVLGDALRESNAAISANASGDALRGSNAAISANASGGALRGSNAAISANASGGALRGSNATISANASDGTLREGSSMQSSNSTIYKIVK